MKKFSTREKVIAAVCGLICAAFLVKKVLVTGVAEYGGRLEDRITVVSGRLAQARQEISREGYYDGRLRYFTDILGKVGSEGAETSSMASRLDILAKSLNVRVLNVQPQKLREEKYYSVFPVEVIFEGKWKDVMNFLSRISSASERMEVRSLRLEKYTDPLADLRGSLVVARFRLR